MPIDIETLNGPQREAVVTIDGPLLVLAGALAHMAEGIEIPLILSYNGGIALDSVIQCDFGEYGLLIQPFGHGHQLRDQRLSLKMPQCPFSDRPS